MASMRRMTARIRAAKARRRSASSGPSGASRSRLRARRTALAKSTFDTDSLAADAALQAVLLAEGQAGREEGGLVDRRRRVVALERVADHAVGLEKRTQDAVGAERLEAAHDGADRLAALRQRVLPGRVVQRHFVAQLAAEGVAVGEEELELEQVAQAQRLVPEFARGDRAARPRRRAAAPARRSTAVTKKWMMVLR